MMSGHGARRQLGIIDYQAGNLQSIVNAFEYLGAEVRAVRSVDDLSWCTHVVLPGVGAFGFCADRLWASGIVPAIKAWAFELERPLLGICVGMQLLAGSSDESPNAQGLGWLGGTVHQLVSTDRSVRIPHVGWNTATFAESWGEFKAGDRADFYFDHSFAYGRPEYGDVLASCAHGTSFSAAVRWKNIVAAQFHPEKSQAAGLRFLRGFLAQ